MHPLTAFSYWGCEPPYDANTTRFSFVAKVRPFRHEAGLATTKRAGIVHLTVAVAVMTAGRRPAQYGARWVCTGIGTNDAVLVDDARPYGGICDLCIDAVAGPQVYWCYAADGALLYIGSAERALRRLGTHRSKSPWWSEVASIRKQAVPEISLARAIETAAIRSDNPRHNKLPRDRAMGAAA